MYWRFKSGSQAELIVLLVFGSIAWGGGYIGATGGIMAMMGHLTGAPKIMLEEHQIRGLQKCYATGKIRWNSGEIEEGRWLIIGSEGQGLAIQGEKKLIHIPKHGKFLKARLKPAEAYWKLVKVKGGAIKQVSFGSPNKINGGIITFNWNLSVSHYWFQCVSILLNA